MATTDYKGPESELTGEIIKAAIEVHRNFGCGLKEEAYEAALCWELRQMGMKVERQKPCPVIYKGVDLSNENDRPRRIDILVEDKVVVECKALPSNDYIFKAQCLTYLKMLRLRVGLVLNFGLPTLKEGIQHVLNETKEEYLARMKREHRASFREVIEEEQCVFTMPLNRAQANLPNDLPVSETSHASVLAPQAQAPAIAGGQNPGKRFQRGVFALLGILLVPCAALTGPFSATLSEGDVEIKAASSQESIDLGRDFDLTLTVTHPAGVKVSLPDLTAMRERFQGFSVADGFVRDETKDQEGRVVREWRWRLVPEPAAEKYRLAPFAVEVRPVVGAATDVRSFPTAPVVFPVAPLEQNVGGDVEISPEPYWIRPTARMIARWILLGLGGLVVLAALVFLFSRLRRAAKLRRMTPSERAFAELSDLLGRGLPQKGLFKDFYIELTHVVRRYIERSHGIRAPEQTTEEFLAAAKTHPRFTPEVIAKLADFLRSADLVKFAGVGSSSSVAEEAVRTARAYIERDAESLSAASGKADNR